MDRHGGAWRSKRSCPQIVVSDNDDNDKNKTEVSQTSDNKNDGEPDDDKEDLQAVVPVVPSGGRHADSPSDIAEFFEHGDKKVSFIKHLVNFIVANDPSINVIECCEFHSLLLLLHEGLKDSNILHRSKLHEEILKAWEHWFAQLKVELQAAIEWISFTVDAWSDDNLQAYLSITSHQIAPHARSHQLVMRAEILAFHHIPYDSHSSTSEARIAVEMMDRASIAAKCGHWTLDNVTSNDSFMKELQHILTTCRIPFDVKDNHIRVYLTRNDPETIDLVPEDGNEMWKATALDKLIAHG
ncbi:hypothetical protein K439DRAFT_1624193 [Ramaria rubella]|nr:hypothetical protein K439DRAFT_1624193 [Ramaria rubella]